MSRVRSFEAPHKGLRNLIGKFSLCLGNTAVADPAQLAQLKHLGDELFTLLNNHVHTENEKTLRYLEEKVPGASAHDRADHERLEAIQSALENRIASLTGRESDEELHHLYLDFSSFHAQYLEHILEEETVTEKLLQEYFTDEELMRHRAEVMKAIPFPVMLIWLRYIVPAQREADSIAMLSGLKAGAPGEAFAAVLDAIKNEMDPGAYKKLVANL